MIGVHIGQTRSTAGRHTQLALQRLRRLMEENRYDEEKGSRRQDMEIYYSFVGKIDLPEA